MTDADLQPGLAGAAVICLSGQHPAPQWLPGQGSREVEALLPAAAVAQVAVQRPAEDADHFHGCGGDEEVAVAGDLGGEKDGLLPVGPCVRDRALFSGQ